MSNIAKSLREDLKNYKTINPGDVWIIGEHGTELFMINPPSTITANSGYQCHWCGSISPDDLRGNCLACGAPRKVS